MIRRDGQHLLAMREALERGARSGRIAVQFARDYTGRLADEDHADECAPTRRAAFGRPMLQPWNGLYAVTVLTAGSRSRHPNSVECFVSHGALCIVIDEAPG